MLHEGYVVVPNNMVFNKNELNNLIFLCLKYTFGRQVPELKEPLNQDIKTLIFELNEDPTPANIIDRIMDFVVERFGLDRLDGDLDGYRRHMRSTIKEFINQPYNLRNDLGDDSDADDLITHH